jgi:hypothetical protein
VNYWEVCRRLCWSPVRHALTHMPCQKYGNVAFDKGQKVVLTSCVLRHKPKLNLPMTTESRAPKSEQEGHGEEGLLNCCFSFTICRDKYGIPSMIVGNFIKC